MATIDFTARDRTRIAALMADLDPAVHDLTRHYEYKLSRADWEFVKSYIRTELRGFLEISLMARAVADAAMDKGLANHEGVKSFLSSRTWARNFDIADENDDRFMSIAVLTGRPDAGASYELATDADTLLEIAEQRMQGSLDDEYLELLREMKG